MILRVSSQVAFPSIALIISFACIAGMPSSHAVELKGLPNFLNQYCVECHGPDEAKGGIDLSRLEQETPEERRYLMELVHEQLQDDLMPPAKAKQPDPIGKEAQVKWLERKLASMDGFLPDDPGVVVMPRLTRSEFENVMRDLTGIKMELKSRLPPDYSAGEGFLNVGEAQSTTDAVIEKYLAATRHALSHARISPVAGITWYPHSLPEIHTLADQRRDLIEAWIDLHFTSFQRQVHEISKTLQEETGTVEGAYLHAAYLYAHRKALGGADWTLQDVAERYRPPLSGAVLQGWWEILSDTQPKGQLVEALKRGWRELPAPDAITEEQLRPSLKQLDAFANAYHRRFNKFEERSQKTSVEKVVNFGKNGRTADFEVDCTHGNTLYLVTTPHLENREGAIAEWQGGKCIGPDDRPLDWKALATISDHRGTPLQWTESDGRSVLRVPAPSVIRVDLPPGVERFEITGAALSGEPGAAIQMFVSKELPAPEQLTFFPGRMALFGGGRKSAAYAEYRKAVEEIGQLGFRPPNFSSLAAFRGFDERYAPYLDFSFLKKTDASPTIDFSPEAARFHPQRPFDLTAAILREHMNAEERQQLKLLENRFARELGVPHWQLQQHLSVNGAQALQEGAWPDASLQATLLEKPIGEELLAALEEEERWLEGKARALIRHFAEQAWSFHPHQEQLAVLMKLYHREKSQRAPFDAAVKRSMQAILLAPYFLYRLPPATLASQESVRQLSAQEYARRLSFFLWSTIPDEELLQKAESGALLEETELRTQIARMLRDERSETLIEEFAGVWLGFNKFPEDADPDRLLFPMFDEELQSAMRQETQLFFAHIFRENRSLLEILSADYTFLNERLAAHYGIEGVKGDAFRMVETAGYPRGGILTQGSLLTLHSKRLRTSPITRGEWILTSVLGVPIPEPPPDVPEISEAEVDDEGLTVAEQLAAHRNSPACQSCHERIDPPGVVLESFDPVGRWRDHYTNGDPIETAAPFQSGNGTRLLESVEDLESYLVNEEAERFTRQATRKMLAYALGRPLLASDHARIDAIVSRLTEADYHIQELIYQIVSSPQFRLSREAMPRPLQAANP